jgi:DNA-binding NarL/FixJ family response regulator
LKILVVDDHALVRAGICQLIRQSYPNCDIAEAGTAEGALSLALSKPLDLVLLDMRLPWREGAEESPANGLSVLDGLCKAPAGPPVVMMSGEAAQDLVDVALRRGAIAVVPKRASPEDLCESIRMGLGESAASSLAHAVSPADLGITPRMYDVLKLALEGHPPWKIALILEINATNVRRYLSRLYETFGVLNLNGLQAHFAKTGQIAGILSCKAAPGGHSVGDRGAAA